jgi:hypothetical protein
MRSESKSYQFIGKCLLLDLMEGQVTVNLDVETSRLINALYHKLINSLDLS